jgi:tetratricopeptide (TPR) repeat protein
MRAVIFAAIVFAAAPASADDHARAKRLYEQGLAHYNAAEYAAAIASWKQAYEIGPSALLLFNLGQAYRLSGDCAQAMTFYDNYSHDAPHPSNQQELDQARALCKAQQPPVDPTPVPAPIVETTPPPIVAPPTGVAIATNPTRSHGKRTAGIAIGATGIAIGVAAIYFASQSADASHELDHFAGEWTKTQSDIQQRGQRDVALAYTLGAVGAAAAITGGVLFVLDRGSSEPRVSVAPTRGGATLAWTQRF